jgi:GNAT superfamily N-acetyltransferase
VPIDHQEFSQVDDPPTRQALAEGRLAELGGLTVASLWRRTGVGEALVSARLMWLGTLPGPTVAVAAIWRASAGSTRLARRYGVRIGSGEFGPYDLYRYNPWAVVSDK